MINFIKKVRFLPLFIIGVLLIAFSTLPGYSLKKGQNSLNVTDMTLQGFDRSTNKLFSLPRLSNPYGLDMDILVSVKVSGRPDISPEELIPRQKLTLSVEGKAYTTPATGDVAYWKESQTRSVFISSDQGITYLPFIVEYQCYPDVVFTASLPESSKSKRVSFPCAE